MPNRKEREEIDGLKKDAAILAEQIQKKDVRLKLTTERLRKQIEDLENRNEEISHELEYYANLKTDQFGSNNNNPSVDNKTQNKRNSVS